MTSVINWNWSKYGIYVGVYEKGTEDHGISFNLDRCVNNTYTEMAEGNSYKWDNRYKNFVRCCATTYNIRNGGALTVMPFKLPNRNSLIQRTQLFQNMWHGVFRG